MRYVAVRQFHNDEIYSLDSVYRDGLKRFDSPGSCNRRERLNNILNWNVFHNLFLWENPALGCMSSEKRTFCSIFYRKH